MTEADDLEAQLVRSQRRRRTVLSAVGIAGAAGLALLFASGGRCGRGDGYADPQPPLTAEQKQELRDAIAKSRAAITAADAGWRAAIDAVDPAAVPTTAPPCNTLAIFNDDLRKSPQSSEFGSWELLDDKVIDRFNSGSMASLTRTPFPLGLVAADQPPHTASPEARFRLLELDRFERALDEPSSTTLAERLRDARIEKLYADNVYLVLDRAQDAQLVAGSRDQYTAGAIRARAWVYDHTTKKVICAGIVTATSSTSVDTGHTNLGDDLLTNLVRAIPDGVRSVR